MAEPPALLGARENAIGSACQMPENASLWASVATPVWYLSGFSESSIYFRLVLTFDASDASVQRPDALYGSPSAAFSG